ncbi:MAG: RHS repeat domain-containing protein [Planctomycetota bacterium]
MNEPRSYDGDQVIAECNESGTLLRKFVYGPGIDEPICMIDVADNNAVYYYHFDGLGSVIALSNENKEIIERYSYDVFGEPNRTSDVNNPYLFTGRRYDPETARKSLVSLHLLVERQ